MTVKESFKKFFIEFAQENFAQVTSENALTIYTAGDKNGAKRTLEEMKSRLEIKGANEWLGWEFLDYIDTELKKMESNETQ